MSTRNDGGPAFPHVHTQVPGYDPSMVRNHITGGGMSLRDYFAAKAMAVVYDDYCTDGRARGFDPGWKDGVAMDSYAMADAMLKARSA